MDFHRNCSGAREELGWTFDACLPAFCRSRIVSCDTFSRIVSCDTFSRIVSCDTFSRIVSCDTFSRIVSCDT